MVKNYFCYNSQSIHDKAACSPNVNASGLLYTCLVLSLIYNLPSFLIEKYTNRHILSGTGPEGVIADIVWWDTTDEESGSPVELCDFRKRVRK